MVAYPLVSIPVITYNSSAYILEGLESIKSQTYKNIEIVISDDCSTDDTVDICNKWIEENRQFFKRAILVTTEKNTGVAGNLNRAISECRGTWIKALSGDDKFFPYTIEEYVKYVNQYPDCQIAFARLHFWGDSKEFVDEIKSKYEKNFYTIIQSSYKVQYRENLKELFLPGPGIIYKKSLWSHIGGFDEDYPFCEEIPFTTKVLDQGERVHFIDKELYKYHIRHESLSKTTSKVHYILKRNIRDYFRKVRRRKMIHNGLILDALDQTISYNIEEAKEKNKKWHILIYSALKYISPLRYIRWFKQHK